MKSRQEKSSPWKTEQERETETEQERETVYWITGYEQENSVIKSALVSSMHMLQLTSCNSQKQTHKLLVGIKQ